MEYKDLKYTKGQVFYKSKAVSPMQTIASIYEDRDGYVTINFQGEVAGSYPNCERKYRKQREFIIKNGFKCDLIKVK